MPVSAKLRFEVFKRDNFTCRYCGGKTPSVVLEADHVIPKSKGGEDTLENLVTSCFACNRGKGKELLETVMLEKDIHDEAIMLLERERQLAEYNNVRAMVRAREDQDLERLEIEFQGVLDTSYRGRKGAFPKAMMRSALSHFSYFDILDALHIAYNKINKDKSYLNWAGSMEEAVGRYWAGIISKRLAPVRAANRESEQCQE